MNKKTDTLKACCEPHVNGWPVIQGRLTELGMRQMALAELLQISPSAVTQIKQGLTLLHAEQLLRLTDFLQMDDAGKTAFYSQIFQARFGSAAGTAEKQFRISLAPPDFPIPDCPLALLEKYEPAIEPLSGYLARHQIANRGKVQLCWDEEKTPIFGLNGRGSFILDCDIYAHPEETVLLKCRDFPLRVCRLLEFTGKSGVFCLLRRNPLNFTIAFPQIVWLRPITIP